jgi:hypothetical protein
VNGALGAAEKVYGREHVRVGRVLMHYVKVLQRLKLSKQAKEMEKRAKAIFATNNKENLAGFTIDASVGKQ